MPLYLGIFVRWYSGLFCFLADIDKQDQEMYLRLIEEMANRQGVTEQLKAEQPMEWIGRMGNIQRCARDVVNSELIYA